MINGAAAAGIEIPRTEALIHYDIALGQHFAQLNLDPTEVALEMERLHVNPEQAAQAEIFVSSGTPQDNESRLSGNHHDGLITLYPVNMLDAAREELGKTASWEELAVDVSVKLSSTTAHEISHFADDMVMGVEAVEAEQRRYEAWIRLRHILGHTLPILSGAGILGSLEVGAVAYNFHPVAATVGSVATAVSCYQIIRDEIRAIRIELATDYSRYWKRPAERRARANATAYQHSAAIERGVPVFGRALPRAVLASGPQSAD